MNDLPTHTEAPAQAIESRLTRVEEALATLPQLTPIPEGASVTSTAEIHPSAHLDANVIVGEDVKIDRDDDLSGCTIGDRCTIRRGATLLPGVVLGDGVTVDQFALLVTDMHDIGPSSARAGESRIDPIIVGRGAHIGPNVTVVGGVTIGKGAVIAAGSVVTDDVDPDVLVAGVPAKVIRRLDDQGAASALALINGSPTGDARERPASPRSSSHSEYLHRCVGSRSRARSDGKGLHIHTANGVDLDFATQPDWMLKPATQYQSTLLWLYSLTWLPSGLANGLNPAAGESLLGSFADFLDSLEGRERLETLTSRDHMSAEALMTLCSLRLTQGPSWARRSINRCVQALVQWSTQPSSIASNNHGMMLANALLHTRVCFPSSANAINRDEVLARLVEILETAFDSTGMCVENTPAYHAFYIRYMDGVIDGLRFVADEVGETTDRLIALKEAAERTLQEVTLTDGRLPSLGDSHLGRAPEAVGGLPDGSHVSPECGLGVIRRADWFFSFKCGQRSPTHKHADDNSITLYKGGKPIILDAGMHNYDWQDPYTECVKSQRGHSGPYWTRFDHLYPASLYRTNNIRVAASMRHETHDDTHTFTGVSTIDGTHTARRRINIADPRRIEIHDSFEGPEGDERVVRFVMNGAMTMRVTDSRVLFSDGTVEVALTWSRPAGLRASRGIEPSERPGSATGWNATSFGKLEPAWVIELVVPATAAGLTTRIVATDLEHSKPEERNDQ